MKENIRDKYADHPHLWFMICIARMINWPESLELIMGLNTKRGYTWPVAIGNSPKIHWDADHMQEAMRQIRVAGGKLWTGAYLIPSGPVKGEPREVHICQRVLKPLWDDRSRFEDAMFSMEGLKVEDLHHVLTTFLGWGQFMAYQVCVDMVFTRYLCNAPDRSSWAAAGPGTLRGLNRLHGRDKDAPLSQAQALEELRAVWQPVMSASGVTMDFTDVPNIMCEFDKWQRAKRGEGKLRATYVPGRGS